MNHLETDANQHNTTSNMDDDVTLMHWCVFVCLEPVLTFFDFVCRSVNENVERPHHAGDGDDVEGD